MESEGEGTYLHSHTLETLCAELVSGRCIYVTPDRQTFQLTDPSTRSIFNWYKNNRVRWSGNVRKVDVEAIVDCLDQAPPTAPASQIAAFTGVRQGIYIKSVRAYNFGGIHRHSNGQNVATFDQSLDAAVVLIEGANGSGKTSILSAVCWAVTGSIFRSQRAPENILEGDPIEVVDVAGGTSHNTTSITPVPPSSFLSGLSGKPVPLDTWVEVVFCNEKGDELGKVRRTLARSPRGKPEVTCTDMGFLGLDPIALRVGTTMPGLIPYIQLGKGSELGEAIGTLTGIQPLEDLASHATRVREKLTSDFVRDRKTEIQAIDEQYLRIRGELNSLFADHPGIKPTLTVPVPGLSKDIEETIEKIKKELEEKQATAFADAKRILGETFDPTDPVLRKDLRDNVSLALASIEVKNVAALPSAMRLNNLRVLKKEEVVQAQSLISELLAEAQELAGIAANPDLARRLQLYARVAGWIHDGDKEAHAVDGCPVCQTALTGKLDRISGRSISEHIQELLSSNKTYLEKSIASWITDATRRLTSGLCKTLQSETHDDLPSQPSDLIRATLVDELFNATAFEKSLAPLKGAVVTLCDEKLPQLPPIVETKRLVFPEQFKSNGTELLKQFDRVNRAIAFSEWRESNSELVRDAIKHVIGERSSEVGKDAQRLDSVDNWSLLQRLVALSQLVQNAAPIAEALGKIEALSRELARRRAKEKRIDQYGRAALAIEPITRLRTLVEQQVKTLMDQLGSRTKYWRDKIYQAAYVGGPTYADASIDVEGAIYMQSETEGARVPAQHVSNASDLRATLLAFLIAFWEHLKAGRGVLSTIMLDDLQELFDPHNRQRIANAVPLLAACGARIITTTNDQDFARKVLANSQSKALAIDHKHVHPLSRNRGMIALAPFEEEVDRKRRIFEAPENDNKDQPARDYMNYLRIYVENRLLDLFDERIATFPDKPTLSDLLGAVRALRSKGISLFANKAFEKLIDDPALKSKGDFLNLMNQSHHGSENLITFNAVWTVRADCQRVRDLVDAAYAEYLLWLRRDSQPNPGDLPDLPAACNAPNFSIPVVTKLAAFAQGGGSGDVSPSGESVDGGVLRAVAFYYIKTQNFGFSGAGNFRAIVSLDEAHEVLDNSLVIALADGKTYARRLLRNIADPTFVALATEVEDPRKRPPSMFLRVSSSRFLPVVGIVLDGAPNYSRSKDEAVLETDSKVLAGAQVAFRVDGDSAMPLALPGQLVIAGGPVEANELASLERQIVAIATTDGDAYLKRVGAAVSGMSYVRHFEAIGGRGDSVILKTEQIEDKQTVPAIISCRSILAVLY